MKSELVEHIRQSSAATRILFMSGIALPADKLTGAPHLRKPFTSTKLLAKVKQIKIANLGIDE
jgi:CheY-like chemotaxis protein